MHERYRAAFADLPVGLPPLAPAGDIHAWHLFILRIEPDAPLDRDSFIAEMAARGIGTSVHFIPLHRHSIWRTTLGVVDEQFPCATEQFGRVVSLPLFSSMSGAQADRVIEAVGEVLG